MCVERERFYILGRFYILERERERDSTCREREREREILYTSIGAQWLARLPTPPNASDHESELSP